MTLHGVDAIRFRKAERRLAKLAQCLWDRCDPVPLRTETLRWLNVHNGQASLAPIWYLYVWYLVGAELASREEDAALSLLGQLTPVLEQHQREEGRHNGFSALYWGLTALANIRIEDWSVAEAAHGEAMAHFNDCPMSREERAQLQRLLCVTGYSLNIQNGYLTDLEPKLLAMAQSAENRLGQVEARLLLGRYYLAVGMTEQATPHLEFAAAQGGQTYLPLEAEILLHQLREQPLNAEQQERIAWRQVLRLKNTDPRHDGEQILTACAQALEQKVLSQEKEETARMLAATALVNLGPGQEAEPLLDQIKAPVLQTPVVNLRLLIRIRQGRLDEAERLLHSVPEERRKDLFYAECQIRLARGDLSGLEEPIRAFLEDSTALFDQVKAHFLMGQYCLALGRQAQAKEHLTFVVEHGGRLYIRKRAEQLLEDAGGADT